MFFYRSGKRMSCYAGGGVDPSTSEVADTPFQHNFRPGGPGTSHQDTPTQQGKPPPGNHPHLQQFWPCSFRHQLHVASIRVERAAPKTRAEKRYCIESSVLAFLVAITIAICTLFSLFSYEPLPANLVPHRGWPALNPIRSGAATRGIRAGLLSEGTRANQEREEERPSSKMAASMIAALWGFGE